MTTWKIRGSVVHERPDSDILTLYAPEPMDLTEYGWI